MSEYEILKECKQAYELLYDLYENSEITNENDSNNIEICMQSLSNVYDVAYQTMLKNEKDFELLKTDGFIRCPRCNSRMYISDSINYAYLCNDCDENMYLTECEVESAWWND